MPGIYGLDFCRNVSKRSKTEFTYFILLTANMQGKDTYMEAINAGIDDFLAKSLVLEQISMQLRVAKLILKYATTIQALESMLPICSYYKKVRDDNNYWQQVETNFSNRTNTSFSHSVCPTCYEKELKPQIDNIRKSSTALVRVSFLVERRKCRCVGR
jgi:response regulator RpfG family c-di-GMP phosphodiesterase